MRTTLNRTIGALAAMLAMGGAAQAVTVAGVYNTGVDATGIALPGGDGAADPHYRIVGGTSPDAVVGQQAKTFDAFGWFMPDTAGARAINVTGDATGTDATTIDFQTTFDLTGYNIGSAVLSGTGQADDEGIVELNGNILGNTLIGYFGTTAFTAANPSWFVAGINVLDFIVFNGSGSTALRIDDLTVSADRIVDSVPEPRTWALLAAGFAMTGAAIRRRSPSPTVAA